MARNTPTEYENVSRTILTSLGPHFGLDRVEPKQEIAGEDTDWELDGKGVTPDGQLVIVEARRWKDRLNQGSMGELKNRIKETGAAFGIVVSPAGLQRGAKKVADGAGIINVLLNDSATPEAYTLQYADKGIVQATDTLGLRLEEIASVVIFEGDVSAGALPRD